MPQVHQAVPSGGPTVPSLPESPGRPGSTSPFAPSAADLPSMPEPALTSRVDETGEDQGSKTGLGTKMEGLGRKFLSQSELPEEVGQPHSWVTGHEGGCVRSGEAGSVTEGWVTTGTCLSIQAEP